MGTTFLRAHSIIMGDTGGEINYHLVEVNKVKENPHDQLLGRISAQYPSQN